MFKRLVCEFLAILQGEGGQGPGPGAPRLTVHPEARQVGDPLVRDLPARPQIKGTDFPEAPGDEEEACVGYLGAAAQLQHLKVLAVLRDSAQAVVRHLLAQREVEHLQAGQVAVEGGVQGRVGKVVAAGEVEALQVRDPAHQLSQRLSQ